jgi:uncharacterized protein
MTCFKLNKDIILEDLIVYIKSISCLVIGDLHIGYEEELHKKGFLIPKFHLTELKQRIEYLINKYKPKNIVLLGDIQHDFKRPSFKVNKSIKELLSLIKSKTDNLFIMKGNHEKALIFNLIQGFEQKEYLKIGEFFFCHGDKIFNIKSFKESKTIIIGHEHPAITLFDNSRKESFKVFLYAKYNKQELIVLPSFNLLTIRTDVLSSKFLSPYINSAKRISVFAIGKKILDFGYLTELKKKL